MAVSAGSRVVDHLDAAVVLEQFLKCRPLVGLIFV